MGIHNGKFYDAKKMQSYCDQMKHAVSDYNNKADLAHNDYARFHTTDNFMGMTADGMKGFIKGGVGGTLEKVSEAHKDMQTAQEEVITMFENMVDPSQHARIEYDTLEMINKFYKELYFELTDRAASVKKLVDGLNEEFGNYAEFEQPDSQSAIDAFIDFCGGEDESKGYIKDCQNKFIAFDEAAKAYLKSLSTVDNAERIDKNVSNSALELNMPVEKQQKHGPITLASVKNIKPETSQEDGKFKELINNISDYEKQRINGAFHEVQKLKDDVKTGIKDAYNDYKRKKNSNIYITKPGLKHDKEIGPLTRCSDEQIDEILKKDAQDWTKEDGYLVASYYELAVHNKDTKRLEHLFNGLMVEEPCERREFTIFKFDAYIYNAHLDPDKTAITLAYVEALNGTTETETYQTLFELGASNINSTQSKKKDFSSRIDIKSKDKGFILNWETSADDETESKYQTMLFGVDGLSYEQKYHAISDIRGLNKYRLNLKSMATSQKMYEYQSVVDNADFEKLSKYVEEDKEGGWFKNESFNNYNESDVYRYINDPLARVAYQKGNNNFVSDHYEKMSDEQKSIYNYLYQKDKVFGTDKAENYRKILAPSLRNEYATDVVDNSNDFEKSLWGIGIGLDKVSTGLSQWSGINDEKDLDYLGDPMPTAISMMDNKIDRSLTGGWQYLYNFNKVAGESMPGVAIGMATGGAGVIGEIAGVAGAAGIYGGSAYGNSKSYAIQNGYSSGEATDFATEVGFKEGFKTMLAYGILRGARGLSSAGYCSGTTAAATAGIGTFGLEFIDETYTTPKIYKDTLGQDIEVDYGEAAKNSAIVATISGAATYVASRQGSTAVEQVEGEGIYEKAHALDGVDNRTLLDRTPYELANMSREQLLDNLPEGWDYQEHNGRVHIKDENSNYKIRIDPPDKKTNYTHIHIFDENKNPLDINGNVVSRKDSAGHIPYQK